jgi:hypothetical protein
MTASLVELKHDDPTIRRERLIILIDRVDRLGRLPDGRPAIPDSLIEINAMIAELERHYLTDPVLPADQIAAALGVGMYRDIRSD